jgi:hypothetical protein
MPERFGSMMSDVAGNVMVFLVYVPVENRDVLIGRVG